MATFTPTNGGLIGHEARQIVETKYLSPENIHYEVMLHTAEKDYYIELLESVEILRDYVTNIADYTLVSFQMYMGDYIKEIVPNMNNLEMTVMLVYYELTFSTRFKFVISNNKGGINGSKYDHITQEELNKHGQINIEGQCVDVVVEAMRTLIVDGVYNYTTVGSVIKSVIKKSSSDLTTGGDSLDIDINMIKPNNQLLYRHINVPTGVNIFDLPSYLQNASYGVYNTSMGTYFQPYGATTSKDNTPRDTMFIYPLHNTNLYDSKDKKLTIIVEPTGIYKNSEYTFLVDGDVVKVLASGDILNYDTNDNDMINHGSSLIASDPTVALTGNKLVTDNSVSTAADLHLSGEKIKKRADGVDKPKYVNNTANLYKHRSDIAKRNLTLYQVEWRFCNHDLLYPGMPTAIIMVNKESGPTTLKGQLQSVYIKYSKLNKSTSALLNIMVEHMNTKNEEK